MKYILKYLEDGREEVYKQKIRCLKNGNNSDYAKILQIEKDFNVAIRLFEGFEYLTKPQSNHMTKAKKDKIIEAIKLNIEVKDISEMFKVDKSSVYYIRSKMKSLITC